MHIPVLYNETLQALAPHPGGKYIDGTLGGAGHSEGILQASAPDSLLLGLDRDPDAIKRCSQRLRPYGDRVKIVHTPFERIEEVALENGFAEADGVLLDLGVSSFQIDEAERGFSFQKDGPLDMRMNNSEGMTAADYLAQFGDNWRDLAQVLHDYGDEPQARKIARAILAEQAREPILTTARLAAVIENALGGRRGAARHPATRSFQALRIAVNRELEQLRRAIEGALRVLKPGSGILAVITFHSIEDRIVKQLFAAHEGREVALQQGGSRYEGLPPRILRTPRKAIMPSERECEENPRARSAKLRVARLV